MRQIVYAFFDHDGIPARSAYATPLLAAIMQSVHDFALPQGSLPCKILTKVVESDGLRLKVDPDSSRLMPITLPLISSTVRTAFAILCARAVYANPDFLWWADGWLTGRDQSRAAAMAMMTKPLAANDRAFVAHWALMSAAFPHEHTLAAQTAALVAAYVSRDVDFASLADAALAIDAE